MNNSRIVFFSVVVILFAGLIIRLANLGNNPIGFFCDEASIGYNAYTILIRGTDEYGTRFPLFFKAFGEFKNPIETYSTVPFIAIFGLNEFAVRLVSVLYGIVGCIGMFFLTRRLFHTEKQRDWVAMIAVMLLTFLPWHIHFSRVSLEGLTAFVCFSIWGTYFYLKKTTNTWFLYVSVLFFSLAIYSYFPARIFIPLFVLGMVLYEYPYFIKNRQITVVTLMLTIILMIPLGKEMLGGSGAARFQQVSIFANHEPNTNILSHIFVNYLSHFSLDFLFLKGDIQMPGQFITRHSVKGFGELYLIQLPFILFGAYTLLRKKNMQLYILLLWLLLYPTGSMLTTDVSAQATRSIIGMVPFVILTAYGFVQFMTILYKKKKPFYYFSILAITFVYLSSCSAYLYSYFTLYPTYSADYWGWQYGARDITTYFAEHQNTYDELIMMPEFNAPDIFFKFYLPEDCNNCFIGEPKTHFVKNKKQLFALTPTYLNTHPSVALLPKKYLYFPSGNVAFVLGEVVK